ncbi:hypothetical protein BVRB_031990, partial [Beta vulgaris subsp. vulgaris]
VLSPALLGRIFTYLTIFEYINVTKVSKAWAKIAAEETIQCMTTFDAAQLWYLLGQIDPSPIITMINQFVNVNKYSFAYCHHLTDAKLLQLLEAIPNKVWNYSFGCFIGDV